MSVSPWINIENLPSSSGSFSRLYRDYIADFKKVQSYYETDFHSFASLPASLERLKAHFQHRETLVEVLREQNTSFGAGGPAMANIRLLEEPQTMAVVTGQQVGMLGGPLYTIYKTITAVKLAAQLREQFPDYRFVPVFWLEGEDHDIAEVSKVGLLNQENTLVQVDYDAQGKLAEKNVGAVGELTLDATTDQFFEELQKVMGNSEFRQPLLELLRRAYAPGTTLNTAFARLLGTLFQESGLVFISANDKRLKKILSPVFLKEIQEFPRVSQLIIERSAELEEGYHAQIKTKALNLFNFHKGGRYFIEPREHDFSLKGTRHFIPKEELLRIGAEQPELLSPNVALRPICQDTILPTIAYVAGPSEVAYFAQLKTVYKYFGLTMPMIYPRATATIVEERFEKILEKYELDIMDFFLHPEQVNRKVIDMVSEINIEEMFSSTLRHLNDQTNELKFGINYIDPTLLGALETTRAKMEFNLSALKEKVTAAQGRKHETALRQIEKINNNLFPNKSFQERECSAVHFMNKHGMGFIHRLHEEIAIDQFKHQVIRI